MRVAMIVDHFPSLSETFILRQITGLIDRGHDVTIFPNKMGDTATTHHDVAAYDLLNRTLFVDVPRSRTVRIFRAVHRLFAAPRKRSGLRALNVARFGRDALSLRLAYSVLRFSRCRSFDVLHCQLEPTGLQGMLFRSLGAVSCPLVTSWRGHDFAKSVHGYRGCTYARLFAEGELFLPVSESLRDQLLNNGCPAEKIRVLHSGLDCREFPYRPRSRVPGRPVRVVTVGRLVPNKGVEYGMQALAALASSGEDVEYHIIGDGPERQRLECLASRLGIGNRVTFHGWVLRGDMPRLLDSFDLLAAPSLTTADGAREGIPNSLKEAMAMAMPVVGTRHSGIPELVEDSVSGYLVAEADATELADALKRLIHEPEKWAEMGLRGRRRIEQQYDIETLNDRLVELYLEAGRRYNQHRAPVDRR